MKIQKPKFIQNILNYISNHRKVTKTQLNNARYEILDIVDEVDLQVQQNTTSVEKNRMDIGILAQQVEFNQGDYSALSSELEQIKNDLYLKEMETTGVTINERELLTDIVKAMDPNFRQQDLTLVAWTGFPGGEKHLSYELGNEVKSIPVGELMNKVSETKQYNAQAKKAERKALWAGRRQTIKNIFSHKSESPVESTEFRELKETSNKIYEHLEQMNSHMSKVLKEEGEKLVQEGTTNILTLEEATTIVGQMNDYMAKLQLEENMFEPATPAELKQQGMALVKKRDAHMKNVLENGEEGFYSPEQINAYNAITFKLERATNALETDEELEKVVEKQTKTKRGSFKEFWTKPRFIDQRIRKDLVTTIENAYKIEGHEPEIELTKIKGDRENPNTKISFRDNNGSGEVHTESLHTLYALEENELESKSELKQKYINQGKHQKIKKPSKIKTAIKTLKAIKEEFLFYDPTEKFTPEEIEITDGLDKLVQSYRVEAAEAKPGKVGALKAVTNYISEKNNQRKKDNLAEEISVYMGLDAKTDVEVTEIDGKLRHKDTTISHTITDKTGKTTDCYMTVGELKEMKTAYKTQSIDEVVETKAEVKGPSKWKTGWKSFKENTGSTYKTVTTSIGMFASDIMSGANSFGSSIGSSIGNSATNKNKKREAAYFAEVIGEHIDAKPNDVVNVLSVGADEVKYEVNGMISKTVQREDLEEAASSLGQKQYVADVNKQWSRERKLAYIAGPLRVKLNK